MGWYWDSGPLCKMNRCTASGIIIGYYRFMIPYQVPGACKAAELRPACQRARGSQVRRFHSHEPAP